jgi:GWxTD domain-containing protein
MHLPRPWRAPALAGLVVIAGAIPCPAEPKLDEGSARWLEVIARWIILPEESKFFRSLKTVEERDRFIRGFWSRRDPTPETPENEFKDEHLRRIAFANAHFGVPGAPGYRTDRGRLYIVAGPPDQIQRNPFGRFVNSRGNPASEHESEIWTYNSLPNLKVPRSVDINFVRYFGKQDFELVTDLDVAADATTLARNELENILAARLVIAPEDFYTVRNDLDLYNDPLSQGKFLDALQASVRYEAPAPVDLSSMRELFEQVITTEISYQQLDAELGSARFRSDTGRWFVPLMITLPAEALTFESVHDRHHARLSLYGEIKDADGAVVDVIEQTYVLEVDERQLQERRQLPHVLFAPLYLAAGEYQMVLLLRDDSSRALAVLENGLSLPVDGALDLSSLVVASGVQRHDGAARGVRLDSGAFVFDSLSVVPSLQQRWPRAEPLPLVFQIYAPGTTGAPLQLEYTLWKEGAPRKRIHSSYTMGAGPLALVESKLDLADLDGGAYTLRLRVSDGGGAEARQELDLTLLQ